MMRWGHLFGTLVVNLSPIFQVGVVQKKDPMGSDKRWFVDNGLTQGFLPCHVLTAFGDSQEVTHLRPEVSPRQEASHIRPEVSPGLAMSLIRTEVSPRQEMSHVRPEVSPTRPEMSHIRPEVSPRQEMNQVRPEVSPTRPEVNHYRPETEAEIPDVEMPADVSLAPDAAQPAEDKSATVSPC
jgi:hypothetical protein